MAALAVLAAVPAAAAGTGPAAGRAATTISPVVLAWGSNFHGELGNGTTTDSNLPTFLPLPAAQRYTVVRSQLDSFAVTASGRLYAWGADNFGELGDGKTADRLIRPPTGWRRCG
jgi:hypothetical protein